MNDIKWNKFRSMNASTGWLNGMEIFKSYDTIVAVKYMSTIFVEEGYSTTTSKQVTTWCGTCTQQRKLKKNTDFVQINNNKALLSMIRNIGEL